MEPKCLVVRSGGRQARGGSIAIILIEAQVRVLSESFLQEQGHHTLTAATPDEALALLDDQTRLNAYSPTSNFAVQAGLELAQGAVKKQSGLRVLYTSCHSVTDGMKALFVENSAFLPKPYTIDQLQTILAVDFGIKPHPAQMPPASSHDPQRPGL